jgi:hypothetical protein
MRFSEEAFYFTSGVGDSGGGVSGERFDDDMV